MNMSIEPVDIHCSVYHNELDIIVHTMTKNMRKIQMIFQNVLNMRIFLSKWVQNLYFPMIFVTVGVKHSINVNKVIGKKHCVYFVLILMVLASFLTCLAIITTQGETKKLSFFLSIWSQKEMQNEIDFLLALTRRHIPLQSPGGGGFKVKGGKK